MLGRKFKKLGRAVRETGKQNKSQQEKERKYPNN